MNPIWGLLFKDRIRTPFSVYKMSLAELVFLGAVAFGCGFGAVKGSKWLVNLLQNNAAEATVETQPVVETESVVVEAQ